MALRSGGDASIQALPPGLVSMNTAPSTATAAEQVNALAAPPEAGIVASTSIAPLSTTEEQHRAAQSVPRPPGAAAESAAVMNSGLHAAIAATAPSAIAAAAVSANVPTLAVSDIAVGKSTGVGVSDLAVPAAVTGEAVPPLAAQPPPPSSVPIALTASATPVTLLRPRALVASAAPVTLVRPRSAQGIDAPVTVELVTRPLPAMVEIPVGGGLVPVGPVEYSVNGTVVRVCPSAMFITEQQRPPWHQSQAHMALRQSMARIM